MENNKVKIAFVGCGRISKKHITAIAENINHSVLVSLCDIDITKAIKMKELYFDITGIDCEVYSDFSIMEKNEDFDMVTIATESGNHYKHAKFFIEKGKHVLVEKPIALSTKHAEEMISLAHENEVVLGVCHQNRFNTPIIELKNAMDNGRFGKVVNGTARILWNRNQNYYDQSSWRGTRLFDGGTLMNQCIHNIDLLIWIMNSRVVSVKSEKGTFLRDIEMEDFGAAILRFENGAIGIIEGSACVYPSNLEETLSFFGETGTVVIGGMAVNKIQTWNLSNGYEPELQNEEVDSVYGKGHVPLYKDYLESILFNHKPLITGEEAIKALNVILSIYND